MVGARSSASLHTTMYTNPYLNRVAIHDPTHFYGRRREVSKIFSRIRASRPQSIAVVGDRRIGKSSLLNYVFNQQVRAQHLDDTARYAFLFVDLQQRRHIGPDELFQDLFLQLGDSLGVETIEGLTPGFDGIRRVLSRLGREGKRLIVIFDEFDAVTTNRRFDLDFYSFLRAIANNYDVGYVTSSARDLQELCHTAMIADSPFFNIFTNVYLRAFTKAEAKELVTVPSAAAGVPLEPYLRDILDIGGQFPFFLQIACSSYFDALVDGAADEGRLKNVVEELFLDEARGHFRFIWDHFTPDQREVLRCFAAGASIDAQQSHVFDDLLRAGYVLEGVRGPRLFSRLFIGALGKKRSSGPSGQEVPPTERIGQAGPPSAESPAGELASRLDDGRIGRFQLGEKLGGGGMGDVYRGYDTELTRTVAVKILAARYASDPTSKRRFLREAQMASILNHPNIATIYEIGEVSGVPYIVMEYVEGVTLSQELAARGPFPITRVVEIGQQVGAALEEAHEKGVVHRDIKASNIILTARGAVKILDFGLAKPSPLAAKMRQAVSDITEPGVLIGTITYMSPEQASGNGEVTQLSDVFSLGVVLYEITTGQLPFDAETYFQIIEQITKAVPTPVQQLRPDAPAGLVRVIERAMKKRPEERWRSAREMVVELGRVR